MKKIVFLGSLLVSSLMAASCLNTTVSSDDEAAEQAFMSDSNRCFNAYDLDATASAASITTKTAGDDFYLHLYKKSECNVNTVTYYLVDNNTGNEIAGTKKTITWNSGALADFEVDKKAYKDVSVKFDYDRVTYSNTPTKLATCPSPSEYTIVTTLEPGSGIFAKLDASSPTGYSCYEYSNTTTAHSDKSTDNFAIKPNKFDINFKKTKIKEGAVDIATIKTLDKNSDIVDNYNNSSMNLMVSNNVQYAFNIQNGLANSAQFIFIKTGDNQSIILQDFDFAKVDTDDTILSCREISGSSNSVDVVEASKYWAGTGTEENENDPLKNNVQTKIKQNTKKDLHFQKMGW